MVIERSVTPAGSRKANRPSVSDVVSAVRVTKRAPTSGVNEPRSNSLPRNSASGWGVFAGLTSWPRALTPKSVKKASAHKYFTRVKVHDPHLTTNTTFATVPVRPMRKFSRNCIGLVLVAAATMGCDTIKARRVASNAAEAYHEGKIEEAIGKWEEATTYDPHIATIQLNLGFANLALYQSNPKGKVGDHA